MTRKKLSSFSPLILWYRNPPLFNKLSEWLIECIRFGKEGGWIYVTSEGGELLPEVSGFLLAYEGLNVVLDVADRDVGEKELLSWTLTGIVWFVVKEDCFKKINVEKLAKKGITVGRHVAGTSGLWGEVRFAKGGKIPRLSEVVFRFVDLQGGSFKEDALKDFIKSADGIILHGDLDQVLKIVWRVKSEGSVEQDTTL